MVTLLTRYRHLRRIGHTSSMEESAPQTQANKGMNKGIILVVFIVIVALAIVGYEATKKKDTTVATTAATPSSAPTKGKETTTTAPTSATLLYKDGTYTVTGNYTSPGGPEEIEVTLTLEGDIITDADVVSKAERPISKEKQTAFIGGFKPLVVGKNIDEVKLDKVSGSSLTPKGFNDALDKVKSEAKA